MTFREKLNAIEDGRFKPVLDGISGLSDICEKCDYFNPHIKDPMKGYRCNCLGTCPAATLSDRMQKYIWMKLDL